jgi:hypothetical protein
MRKMTRHVLGAAGLALIVTTSVVWAQEAQPDSSHLPMPARGGRMHRTLFQGIQVKSILAIEGVR